MPISEETRRERERCAAIIGKARAHATDTDLLCAHVAIVRGIPAEKFATPCTQQLLAEYERMEGDL